MHLTNYAVNKHNENFVSGPEADSSKWDFATLRYTLGRTRTSKDPLCAVNLWQCFVTICDILQLQGHLPSDSAALIL